MFKLNQHFVFQSGTEACEKCKMKEVCNLVNGSCNIEGLFICYFTFQSFKDILKMTAISDMKIQRVQLKEEKCKGFFSQLVRDRTV